MHSKRLAFQSKSRIGKHSEHYKKIDNECELRDAVYPKQQSAF